MHTLHCGCCLFKYGHVSISNHHVHIHGDTHVRVKMGGIVVHCWMVVGLFFIVHHSTEARDGLPSCSDQLPPCIESQSIHQSVCSGDNVTAMVGLRIPLQKIQHVNLIGIAVYRGTKLFTEGLDSNPDLQHWSVSYLFSKADGKSGLLTVKVDVQDVQPEDEFETHMEITLGEQTLKTSGEIWFTVNDNCSNPTSQPMTTKNNTTGDFMHQLHQDIEVIKNSIKDDVAARSKEQKAMMDYLHSINTNYNYIITYVHIVVTVLTTLSLGLLISICIFAILKKKSS